MKRILTNRAYLGEYIYKDIVTKHEEVRIVDEDQFEKVRQRLEERSHLGVSNRYYDKKMDRYRQGMSFGDKTSDPVVQEYLQKKAGMPPCPRCGDRMNVIMYGKHNSPTVGELQQYCCRPCNYEFMLFPELPQREDVEPCPECRRRVGVSKHGHIYPKSHEGSYQRYHCRFCNRWFQEYPREWKKPKPPCPACESRRVRGNGRKPLVSGTLSLKYVCQECGRHFSVHDATEGDSATHSVQNAGEG